MIDPAAFVVMWLLVAPEASLSVSDADQAPGAAAAQPSSIAVDQDPRPAPVSDRRTLKALPANILAATTGLWSRETIWPLTVGAALTGAAVPLDDRVRRSASDPGARFGRALETAGQTLYTGAAVVWLYAVSHVIDAPRLKSTSYDMIDGTIVAGALTTVMKAVAHRERPDGSDHYSFPSGHSSNAFTLATIATMHYGWNVGVPAFAGAALVGYSRLVRDKHYLSDVTAGAVLGVLVARSVVRQNSRPPRAGAPSSAAAWSIAPVFQRRGTGLMVTVVLP